MKKKRGAKVKKLREKAPVDIGKMIAKNKDKRRKEAEEEKKIHGGCRFRYIVIPHDVLTPL